ncbi:type II toxin-antitoxin system HicB family antitoxin [uncultured Bacteroides sp.]|uniref:type II toxin-antitoxin system HicB family antitoxin n=1 Tax=uncultured Bacteroides sp. TaxID=162156 RepID=UPI002618DD11|nr:type II toxin-antitoxin system HicB family antitoxin [uncultured Bacteroides sp.]
MEVFGNEYAVGCTGNGGYYAYLLSHEQCCAYGETAEEALENLQIIADEFFDDICSVFSMEA